MEIKAQLKHLGISPRKVRLVVDLIRGLDVNRAEQQLQFCAKRAAKPVLKLLRSVMANAQHNFNLTKDGLYVSKVVVNQGPTLKRWRARAMGRTSPILKKTSHIILILDERIPSERIKKKAKAKDKLIPEAIKTPTLPPREKVSTKKRVPIEKRQKTWASEKSRKQKRRFYIGDKFKGAAERARRVFRRKSI